MSFDFSALLVLLTLVSGLIWGFDAWFLAPRRQRAAQPEPEATPQGEPAPPPREPLLTEYARSFFPVFLIVLVLRAFIVEPFRIPSASMMPTLLIGDFILVNKYDYGIRLPVLNVKVFGDGTPKRGDIVVFRYPEDPSIPFIKRVIGVPGDTVEYRDKTLYINGHKMDQDRIGRFVGVGAGRMMDGTWDDVEHLGKVDHQILIDPDRPSYNMTVVVPENEYFVLGDNRDDSKDSRYWGFVPDRNLIGRAFMIWMNWDSKNGGINWKRIGTILK